MLIFFFHVAFYGLNVTVTKYRGVAINYGFWARHLEIIKKRDALPAGWVYRGRYQYQRGVSERDRLTD